ncbi:molybdenum cofactor guanylyltransferase MobA [Alkanindiges illinoisensis]|nr:molybdenum cofactor guanylyltransferase MobA [Alkanindiges illinoisensis]
MTLETVADELGKAEELVDDGLVEHGLAEHEQKVSIVILAGGRATRMHGQDKGLVLLHGQPLVVHLYQQISSLSDDILINANRNQATYQQLLPACQIISDQWADFKGPLAGMHSALRHASHEYILIIPCDLLMLPKECLGQLWQAMQKNHSKAAYASFNGQALYPFCMLHRSLLDSLALALANDQYAVRHWLFEQEAAVADFAVDNILPLNLNTPDDVALAEQCYASEIPIFSDHFNSGAK